MNKIDTVTKMQKYIKEHIEDDDFCIDEVYSFIGYTERHCFRLFKDVLGMTPAAYIKSIRLSNSAEALTTSDKSILSVAVDSGFQTNEGFTRSFKNRFSINPSSYRKSPCPIPLFTQYPANHYFIIKNKEGRQANKESMICTATAKFKSERKIIFKRAKYATGYLSYCEENGCDWEGLLNSIKEKTDTAAIIDLPDNLIKSGYSRIAAGIEVPADYNFEIDGYETAYLSQSLYLCFQSEPYENEDDFALAIASVDKAVEKFDYKRFSYSVINNKYPSFHYGAQPKIGARAAIPIELI